MDLTETSCILIVHEEHDTGVMDNFKNEDDVKFAGELFENGSVRYYSRKNITASAEKYHNGKEASLPELVHFVSKVYLTVEGLLITNFSAKSDAGN